MSTLSARSDHPTGVSVSIIPCLDLKVGSRQTEVSVKKFVIYDT